MQVMVVILCPSHKTPQSQLNRFAQKFYGQEASTRGKTYRYRKKGLLDTIPHRKLRRGVVVVREEDLAKVEAFLDEWGVPREVRVIRPTAGDVNSLTSRRG